MKCTCQRGGWELCPVHSPITRTTQNDSLDNMDRDGGQLEDASEDAMITWARHYDDLNGAPENEEDC
jgi:hypothetical protein